MGELEKEIPSWGLRGNKGARNNSCVDSHMITVAFSVHLNLCRFCLNCFHSVTIIQAGREN